MVIFPLAATLIAGVFAVLLFRQWGARRRLSQLAWAIAMVQFALASLLVAAGVSGGWDPTLYRGFWLFGAVLNVPWLALGSVALISKPLVSRIALGLVSILSVYGIVAIMGASPDASLLSGEPGIPRGSEVWGAGASALSLARLYSISAWLVVVGIAVWSSTRRGERRPTPDRIRGNVLIAAGTSLVAIGGFALGRVGRGEAFSVTLALGIAVMFTGFLFASRPPRTAQ